MSRKDRTRLKISLPISVNDNSSVDICSDCTLSSVLELRLRRVADLVRIVDGALAVCAEGKKQRVKEIPNGVTRRVQEKEEHWRRVLVML